MKEELPSLERKSSTLSVFMTSSGICSLNVKLGTGQMFPEYTEAKVVAKSSDISFRS